MATLAVGFVAMLAIHEVPTGGWLERGTEPFVIAFPLLVWSVAAMVGWLWFARCGPLVSLGLILACLFGAVSLLAGALNVHRLVSPGIVASKMPWGQYLVYCLTGLAVLGYYGRVLLNLFRRARGNDFAS